MLHITRISVPTYTVGAEILNTLELRLLIAQFRAGLKPEAFGVRVVDNKTGASQTIDLNWSNFESMSIEDDIALASLVAVKIGDTKDLARFGK